MPRNRGRGHYNPDHPDRYITMFHDVELGPTARLIMSREHSGLLAKLPTLAQRLDMLSECLWKAHKTLTFADVRYAKGEPLSIQFRTD